MPLHLSQLEGELLHSQLIDLLLELDFLHHPSKTITEMDVTRDEFEREADDKLVQRLGAALGTPARLEAIDELLEEMYPEDRVLGEDSPYRRWGGCPEEMEEDPTEPEPLVDQVLI